MAPIAGFPPLPPERWRDVQAVAAYKSLPLKHEKLAQVLGIARRRNGGPPPHDRPLSGQRKPASSTAAPIRWRGSFGIVTPMSPARSRTTGASGLAAAGGGGIWRLTETINQRGIAVDMAYVRAMKKIVTDAAVPLLKEFRDLTGDQSGPA